MFWSNSVFRKNRNHDNPGSPGFQSFDKEWFKYVIILENSLDGKWAEFENNQGERDWLMMKFMFQAVYPFMVLSPCGEEVINEWFLDDLDLYMSMSPHEVKLRKLWMKMEEAVKESEFDQALEDELVKIIMEKGEYGEAVMWQITDFASAWVPKLFEGEAIKFERVLTKKAIEACTDRFTSWSIGFNALTLPERLLFYIYFDRYDPHSLNQFLSRKPRNGSVDDHYPPGDYDKAHYPVRENKKNMSELKKS